MLSDEPDGMQIGDLVLLPHLPREWRWSVVRITGPYRYEIARPQNDYGHILPVDVVAADLGDDALTPELRWMRVYPARLRRLSREAYEDLVGLVTRPTDA
jgi:predicted Mrr-cat superfamily restriction endonuclease